MSRRKNPRKDSKRLLYKRSLSSLVREIIRALVLDFLVTVAVWRATRALKKRNAEAWSYERTTFAPTVIPYT